MAAGASLLVALLWCAPAAGHGPTVQVSYRGMRPVRLVIAVGETVHFRNANTSGLPCTVVADDGSFRSPELGRGGGWHFTFEAPGSYPFGIAERSSARGTIFVGEPP